MVTLMTSNSNITTCRILTAIKYNGSHYELRYYSQLDKFELIKYPITEYSKYQIRPTDIVYGYNNILNLFNLDSVPIELTFEFEKFMFEHITGDRGCLNANV
jgi:hypothetical protein